MSARRSKSSLVVLQSFPRPRATTNPYLSQLVSSAPEGVEVLGFSWRTALLTRYHVFHLHWPELLLRSPNRARALARHALFVALLLRARVLGIPVVRTLHNTEAHEPGPAVERLLIDLSVRWTTLWIRLNPRTQPPRPGPVRTILHGDYSGWFAAYPASDPVPGRLLYFGLIRGYKGVGELITTFQRIDDENLSLHVVGRPITEALHEEVVSVARGHPRVHLDLEHVEDGDLAREIGEAEVVVLPYRELHNSGAALLALSLHRPILVPAGNVTEDLTEEVGPSWVLTFRNRLDPEHLQKAVVSARTPRATPPDLSLRSWDLIAQQHAEAYSASLRAVVRHRWWSRAASGR